MFTRWVSMAAVVLLSMSLGALLGYVLVPQHSHDKDVWQVREKGNYKFINPLLECEVGSESIGARKNNFRPELELMVDEIKKISGVTSLAVYYRDLNNGPAFGVGENERYLPASLLKVPVAIAYFDASEDDPAILSRQIRFTKKYEDQSLGTQQIKPEEELVVGESYSVRDLIRRSIVYSDNQAVTLLIDNIHPKYIRNVYQILGVPDEVLNGPGGSLTVREYASFFRILFNASYLDRSYSEELLSILSQSTFSHGLLAGVPKGTRVSHKFGESGFERDHQIHDCGVIYYPDRPYLLCVMTRGSEIPVLENAIKQTSQFVWEKVKEQDSIKE